MDALPVPPPAPGGLRRLARAARRHHNALLFIGGFLFDVFTLKRIDSWTDLGIQLAYLLGLTLLLLRQYMAQNGLWTPGGWAARLWDYNVEALHFFYGGLLSNYVVLYFKSSSGARPLVFFSLLVALLFLNEVPQIRRVGHRLRLGLYAFCVASFLIYFVPVLIGRMGDWVFYISLLLSLGAVWGVSGLLASKGPEEGRLPRRVRVFAPAGGVLAVLAVLYLARLVPPVPLSVKFHGVYHGVIKDASGYRLLFRRPPFWAFWRKDSRPFAARPGDRIHYFVRIFAPTRFKHRVMIRWEKFDEVGGRFVTVDRIPLEVSGGRDAGFRGYAVKGNHAPGLWRVGCETEDGRVIGRRRFPVRADDDPEERGWGESRS